jgi:DNA mismatch endonuclease (patch repair protein)
MATGRYANGMTKRRRNIGYPHPSSPQARSRMQACGQKDTAPERALRAVLYRLGLRYRLDSRPIPGLRRKADILFPGLKIAIFVDGCFWHGCPVHATWPVANGRYWRDKILRNRNRDRDTDRRLAKAGWLSIRVWEHEAAPTAAERIRLAVQQRRAQRAEQDR